jgi:hypothetical protein
MLAKYARIRVAVVLALASVTLLTTSALAQNEAARTDIPEKKLPIQLTASSETSKKLVTEPTPETVATAKKSSATPTSGTGDLEAELAAMKAENSAVKERLRRMEEGQRILIEQLNSLRSRLDRTARIDASAGQPIAAPGTADASAPTTDVASNTAPAATDSTDLPAKASSVKQAIENRYQDGIVIWKTPNEAPVPFLLRFNNNTQHR